MRTGRSAKQYCYYVNQAMQTDLRRSTGDGAGSSRSHGQEFVGEAMEINNGWMTVEVKNKFQIGDRLEFILPNGKNYEVMLTNMENMEGASIEVALGNGHIVRIPAAGIDAPMVLISRFL